MELSEFRDYTGIMSTGHYGSLLDRKIAIFRDLSEDSAQFGGSNGRNSCSGNHSLPSSRRPDESMAWILKRMLQNPQLPEKYRQPSGWPAAMREEWGSDEGTTSAKEHRERHLVSLRKVRAAIDAFRPDFIVVWGDDQYENFREEIVPSYCIYAHDAFEYGPPSKNIWNEAPDKKFRVQGDVAAAKYLAGKLLESGFDTAYSYKPLHHPLGHAFANALLYLDYDRKGFPHPIIPFAINCYGRRVIAQHGGLPVFDNPPTEAQLDPPAPTPARLFDLGIATARILRASPWRVALMASSGWSPRVSYREELFSLPGYSRRPTAVPGALPGQI